MASSMIAAVSWNQFFNIINGEQRSAQDYHHGIDPCTGKELWAVPVATENDLNDAVRSASATFTTFSQKSLEERKMLPGRYKDVLLAHADYVTDLLCLETGKPRAVAEWESKGVAEWFDHHLQLMIPHEYSEDDEKTITTRYQPLGVVGAICPWNFPLLLSLGKIIPAILTGNTIIIKPSPYTPYSTLKVVELAQSVFEPGVIQVVGGNDQLGPQMTSHNDIAKISFTGSTAVGKKIMAACAGTMKRLTLELGGNDAAIVLPDVDVKVVASEIITGAFQNSGQICVGTKRIYIHEDIYDELLLEMAKFTKSMALGDPASGAPMGPIQNLMQFDRVKASFKDARDNGYTFATGEPEALQGKGYYIHPAIIDNPPDNSLVVAEEAFGPIVPALRWNDENDVIRRANDTITGLGASVWSRDVAHAQKIGARLQCGSVWINSYGKPSPLGYFGGHKQSGIGGEWGTEGLKSYCNIQVTHTYKNDDIGTGPLWSTRRRSHCAAW